MITIYFFLTALTFIASLACLLFGIKGQNFIAFGVSGWIALLATLFLWTWLTLDRKE